VEVVTLYRSGWWRRVGVIASELQGVDKEIEQAAASQSSIAQQIELVCNLLES
jgi:hypothetical protein